MVAGDRRVEALEPDRNIDGRKHSDRVSVASSGYIDISLALFVTLAIYSLCRWWSDRRAVGCMMAIFLGQPYRSSHGRFRIRGLCTGHFTPRPRCKRCGGESARWRICGADTSRCYRFAVVSADVESDGQPGVSVLHEHLEGRGEWLGR